MNENRTSLEIIAPTVEEAINKGLIELGLSRDRVEIDVLDEGSRGLFGIGFRQARIRLSILPPPQSESPDRIIEVITPLPQIEKRYPPLTTELEEEPEFEIETIREDIPINLTNTLALAKATVQELLEKMGIKAEVSASIAENKDSRGRKPILINISGADLSILIGRQSETLNAMQFITTLIVSKELNQSVSLIIDVEGYRQRREQQLRQIAHRMADQAIKTGRRQILEPMPANERRIIHMELRPSTEVKTESIGEEPRRKVTIIPIR
jgi:spoIIIJ-associated protein